MKGTQTSIRDNPSSIRRAQPEDAAAIYDLKKEAFGNSYLLYTIYQAPQSVRYLARIIGHEDELATHYLYVIDGAKQLGGYYHAVHRDARFFLNYIAISRDVQHRGWGSILLRHYEHAAKSLGCCQLGLDVFESNGPVVVWYQRHGYSVHSSSFLVRLAIRSLFRPSLSSRILPLDCRDERLACAIEEERLWGFSKVDCTCGAGSLTIGLIAGCACKLIHYERVSIEEAILGIAASFHEQREVLILSGVSTVSQDWPVLSIEKVIRMRKPIGQQA